MDDVARSGQIPEVEDSHTIGRMTARKQRIEVITRGERRRAWSVEQKREIVAESLDPATTPSEVARKHEINTGLLYAWRRQMLDGRLEAPSPSAARFARAELASLPRHLAGPSGILAEGSGSPRASARPLRPGGRIEVMLPDGVVLRVDAEVDAAALRRVLEALRGR